MSELFNAAYPAFQNCGCTLLRWPIKDGVLNEDALNPVSGDWSIKPGTRTLRAAMSLHFDAAIFSRPGCGAAYGQWVTFDGPTLREVWYRIYLGATTDGNTWLAVDHRHHKKDDDTFQCTNLRFTKCVSGTETVLKELFYYNSLAGFTGAIWKQEIGRLGAIFGGSTIEIDIADPSPYRCQWGVGHIDGRAGGYLEWPGLLAKATGKLYTAFTGCERRCSVQGEITNSLHDPESDCGDPIDAGGTPLETIYFDWQDNTPGTPDATLWSTGDFAVVYTEVGSPTSAKRVINRIMRVHNCTNAIDIELTVGAGTAGRTATAIITGLFPNDTVSHSITVDQGTSDTLSVTLPIGFYYVSYQVPLGVPTIYFDIGYTGSDWVAAC